MDFKNLKKKSSNQKSVIFPNVCDFQKEIHTQGMDLKIYSLAYGFLFFVISISGLAL